MKFYEKLRNLRKEKGLSQEEFAEMLNVSRQAISKWESGQSYPETDKLITISEIFGVTLDSLIKDAELETDRSNTISSPFWLTRGSVYEYKSKKTLLGLPLVHINVGRGIKKAKGIIAIGNIATGVISIGLIAQGGLAIGLLSLGFLGIGTLSLGLLLAIGAISIGTISIGAIAIGILTLGAVSIGMFSVGALSVASHVAIGDHAYGHIAIGRVVSGTRTLADTSAEHYFSTLSSNIRAYEVRQVILEEFPNTWNWIVHFLSSFFR